MSQFSKIKNSIDLSFIDVYSLPIHIAYLFGSAIFICWATDFYMDQEAAIFLAIAATLFFIFGGGFLRSTYLFTVGFCTLFQNHLVTNYSYPFAKIGREILLLTSETTSLEFATYLHMITWQEYSDFIALVLFSLIIYKYSPKQRNKRYPVCIGLFLLAYVMWNDVGVPVYAYQQEMSESAVIIDNNKKFTFQAKDVSEEERSTYIIVIGETHRYNFFEEYGYSQEHSPNLHRARQNNDLYAFSDVTSGYAYTTGSVPIIMTRKPIEYDNRFYEEKSIISAFKEAGYATYTISYTKKTQPEDDAMNMIFLEADKYINHAEYSDTFDDVGMLPFIKEILNNKEQKKKLIVIKMIGAHYLYEDRFPKKYDIHQPSFKTVYDSGEAANNPQLLRNSYKNAIIYSANFVDQLAGLAYAQEEPVLMTFMSDHGTVLLDDDKSKYVGRAKGSYHIAFFITANNAFWQNTSNAVRNNLENRKDASLNQEYFFETYLSLAKIKYFEERPRYNIAGAKFVPAKDRIVWTSVGLEQYDELIPEKPALD